MAAGFGEQVAYDSLVRQMLRVELDKGSRFTDWGRRPLSDSQLVYALGDVTHLAALYPKLRDRLKKDILATRRAEYDAQFQKTEAVRAKAAVVDAVSKSTAAASAVENVKQSNVRDAKVATAMTKFDEAATTMAADKLAAERSAGVQAANAISAQAAGMTLPASLEESSAAPVVNTSPAVTAAAAAKSAPEATASEARTSGPAAVAATGSGKPVSVSLSQAKAQAQTKVEEEAAIKARMAVIQAQMAARKRAENTA